jgi:hypothetical protein
VIPRIKLDGAHKRAFRSAGVPQRIERAFDLRQERQIDAQPEMAFDALLLKTRGLFREKYAASVRAPSLIFRLRFLTEKEERAPQSPRRFIRACVLSFEQKLNARAHVTLALARFVEHVGTPCDLFEWLLHQTRRGSVKGAASENFDEAPRTGAEYERTQTPDKAQKAKSAQSVRVR